MPGYLCRTKLSEVKKSWAFLKDIEYWKTNCCENGLEFISKISDKWAYLNHVTLHFSRPGKPTDNAFIESFNGSFRDERLNSHWFLSLDDAKNKIEEWRLDYNDFRPHSLLNNLTPNQFKQKVLGAGFLINAGLILGRGSISVVGENRSPLVIQDLLLWFLDSCWAEHVAPYGAEPLHRHDINSDKSETPGDDYLTSFGL
ncbi:putative transposase [Legionella hackeliae]|nr:putative transposase [Legionella hackeliae]STX49850.1 putative transposase [Legionella hackeliae]